jgi:hypothetical protein
MTVETVAMQETEQPTTAATECGSLFDGGVASV